MQSVTIFLVYLSFQLSYANEIIPGYWEKKAVEHIIQNVEVPDYLYHWTRYGSLNEMARSSESPTKLPLKNRYGSVLGDAQAIPYEVLMTSSNPVAGMGTDLELYAQAHMHDNSINASWIERWKNRNTDNFLVTQTPARLITIKPKRNATFHVVITKLMVQNGQSRAYQVYRDKRGVENPDLIYHLHVGGSLVDPTHLKFHEWAVLNPEAVEWFSADPEAARKQIEAELIKFDDPKFNYKPEEKTISTEPLPKFFKRILSDFLKGGVDEIPEMFRSQAYRLQCDSVISKNN